MSVRPAMVAARLALAVVLPLLALARRRAVEDMAHSAQVQLSSGSTGRNSAQQVLAELMQAKPSFAQVAKSGVGGTNRLPVCTDDCCRCTGKVSGSSDSTVEVDLATIGTESNCNEGDMWSYIQGQLNLDNPQLPRVTFTSLNSGSCHVAQMRLRCPYHCSFIFYPGSVKYVFLTGRHANDDLVKSVIFEHRFDCNAIHNVSQCQNLFENSGQCALPSLGWCSNGQLNTNRDCDGDGINDPHCTGSSSTGYISSAQGCFDTWPNGGCEHIFR